MIIQSDEKAIDLSGNPVDVFIEIAKLKNEDANSYLEELRDYCDENIVTESLAGSAWLNFKVPAAGERITLPPPNGVRAWGQWNRIRLRKMPRTVIF
jgi:hypothetical protein